MTENGSGGKDYCVIMVSVGNDTEAERIARTLVERRLAACVQEYPITSSYVWQGEFNRDAEILLLIKTRSALFPDVRDCVKELHSYDVAEVLQVPVISGADDYLSWIVDSTSR
ncbi:divalent-cation tolerance protein CutA [Calidifontibacter indicus]|uniref:divalent-cation tolerance protein CutA n=1 Tax=Calidifontibacter indicus TaxID=419650 RepID=UPI003D708EAC